MAVNTVLNLVTTISICLTVVSYKEIGYSCCHKCVIQLLKSPTSFNLLYHKNYIK